MKVPLGVPEWEPQLSRGKLAAEGSHWTSQFLRAAGAPGNLL